MTGPATHIHIFYTDRNNGWAVQVRDADGYQIGEAEYFYFKSDAIHEASRYNAVPIHIFGQNGLLQRIIKGGAS